MTFSKSLSYLQNLDQTMMDPLDKISIELLQDPVKYERASQALRRRFVRGASLVPAIDRNNRTTSIKRERSGGTYIYFVQGIDGSWTSPDERIWVVAMYALWQSSHN